MPYDLTPTQQLLCRLLRKQGMWNPTQVELIMDAKFPDYPEWKAIALDALAAEAPMLFDNDAFPNNPVRPTYDHQDFSHKVTQQFLAVLAQWLGMENVRILADACDSPDWRILAGRALLKNPLSDDLRSRIQP